MRYLLLVIFLISANVTFAQQKKFTDYSFDELLTASNLSFKMPRGFYETPVIPDNGHLYQFAMKDSTMVFECRFYVRPYALFYGKGDTKSIEDPLTRSFFMTSVLNVSGAVLPNVPRIDDYPTDEVKSDFNADVCMSSAFEIDTKFGTGYRWCIAFIVQKALVGEITMFMLFNDINNRQTHRIIDSILGSIDFK